MKSDFFVASFHAVMLRV